MTLLVDWRNTGAAEIEVQSEEEEHGAAKGWGGLTVLSALTPRHVQQIMREGYELKHWPWKKKK